jgi:hypothetical protein
MGSNNSSCVKKSCACASILYLASTIFRSVSSTICSFENLQGRNHFRRPRPGRMRGPLRNELKRMETVQWVHLVWATGTRCHLPIQTHLPIHTGNFLPCQIRSLNLFFFNLEGFFIQLVTDIKIPGGSFAAMTTHTMEHSARNYLPVHIRR